MAIEFFGAFDNGRTSTEYLRVRARIRRAIDVEFGEASPAPPAEAAINEAAGRVGSYTMSEAMRPGGDLGVDSVGVGVAFAAKVSEHARDLQTLLSSPIARVAGATESRAEVAFVDIALLALWCVSDARSGLDLRCEDLRQELNQLQELLWQSGEEGEVESWEPVTEGKLRLPVDLDGP